MKNYINLFFSLAFTCAIFSQNSQFYKTHLSMPSLEWYYQLNTSPVIIQNGDVINENLEPTWLNAFMFYICPGSFSSSQEAYTYLSNDSNFLSDDNFYYNRLNQSKHNQYFNTGKDIYNRSKSYSSNQEALNDFNHIVLAGCRESIIFGELYLKINNQEFLILDHSEMYLFGYNSTSSTDINNILDFLRGTNTSEIQGLTSVLLHKEEGVWKYVDNIKAELYLDGLLNDNVSFTDANGGNQVHVESTVNTSGVRVFTQN